MVSGNQLNSLIIMELPTKPTQGRRGFQEGLRGDAPQSADQPRSNNGELSMQVGLAELNFFRKRISILGWPTFQYVADKHLFPAEMYCRQHPGQQLTGSTDEGSALEVLIPPRGFPDEHNLCFWIPLSKDEMVSGLMQRAFHAVFYLTI